MLSGFILGGEMKLNLRNRVPEILRILGVNDLSVGTEGVLEKIKELKEENLKYENVLKNLTVVHRFGVFHNLANSSSYYTKNKEIAEETFYNVVKRERMALMSADILSDGKAEIHKNITDRFKKMGLDHSFVEEISGRSIYIIGFNKNLYPNIKKQFGFTIEQLSNNGHRVLISFSREINDLSSVFEAYKDIKICRDYRCMGDSSQILTAERITMGSSLILPVNFTDELKSFILEADEEKIRKYISKIFNKNIENKIPVIKFEHLLRIMQNTFTEAVTLVKKAEGLPLELEQYFIHMIDSFKDTLDVENLINSYVNILRFGAVADHSKKAILNRTDVMKYINANYNKDLYLEIMAVEFGTTPKYFSNYFKREFSVGFCEYLSNIRISHAKQILCDSDLSLSVVGEKVGYSNPTTFTVAFKKRVGMSPGKFRELNKKRS